MGGFRWLAGLRWLTGLAWLNLAWLGVIGFVGGGFTFIFMILGVAYSTMIPTMIPSNSY